MKVELELTPREIEFIVNCLGGTCESCQIYYSQGYSEGIRDGVQCRDVAKRILEKLNQAVANSLADSRYVPR